MCFSTEASFTAAAVLGVIGYSTLKKTTSRSQLFLAAIPLLFAIQQFAEGILWFTLSRHLTGNLVTLSAEKIFLTFAFLIWPIWIPLSLAALEKISWRCHILYAALACGITLSLLNLSYGFKQNISVQIINHSIQYIGQAPPQNLLYPLIILLPCFVSSYKNVWLFGIFVSIAYVIADYYYTTTFVSVWCFFAALVSVLLYKIIKDNQTYEEKKPEAN